MKTRKRNKKNNKIKSKTYKRNKKVGLKNNFYYFVNNEWVKNTYISKNNTYKSLFTVIERKVYNDLLQTIKKHLLNANSIKGKQCTALYKSMTNWNDILVETQTYLFIKQINEFRKIGDTNNLYLFLKWALYNGLTVPVNLGVIHDIKYPKIYIPNIGESGLTFVSKEMYFNNNFTDIRNAFKSFIKYLFNLFFGENHCYNADDVFEIELEMAKKMYNVSDSASNIKTYNKYNSKKAKALCNFNFDMFLKEFGIKNIKYTNFTNPEFTKNVFNMMNNNWNNNKWNSYWIYRLLIYVSKFHSKLHKFVLVFFTNKINETVTTDSIVMDAIHSISTVMNSTVSKLYIKHHVNTAEIKFVTELMEKIKKAFKLRITKNTWLNSVTKERALLKIDKLTCAIGYRDNWAKDPDCMFEEDDAIENNAKYIHWIYAGLNTKLHNPTPDNSYWTNADEMNVYDVNAFYNNLKNELILPNAILQKPFIDLSKKISHNLAYIGFIIAHELVHGFDSEGCMFDENGVYNHWWTKDDYNNYKHLQNDVVEHYEALAKKDGVKLDGNQTLDENIADISALNIIEDTLEMYLIDNNIFGEQQQTYFKDMYHNYAIQWRTVIKKKQILKNILLDQHSLSKYRVNCVLMRSNRFAQIFDISNSDGMHYERKINEIW